MKLLLPLVSAIGLLAATAQADFVPGRVRVDAKADMRITETTGAFQNVRQAQVTHRVKDGGGEAGYAVTLDGKTAVFEYSLPNVVLSCAKVTFVKAAVPATANYTLDLKIYDYTNSPCTDIRPAALWHVIVTKRSLTTFGVSTITMDGNPEHLMLTM